MSGGIFQPLDILADFEDLRRNPLLCYLCNSHYEEPCLLQCYHSFCTRCLRGRALDNQMQCPLCGVLTHLKDGSSLPPKDHLLKFLVESSTEEKVQCANCDTLSRQMYFCNTCDQPLCTDCRENTHRAKMFAKHEIVVLAKRTKEIHKKCALHGEPYIMFSTENKVMLCINCFRDTNIESRTHCIDLETAYTKGCKKLDQEVQAIRELQNSVRDGIILLRALLNDIMNNSETEKKSIKSLYEAIQNKLTEKKDELLQEVDRQFKDKQQVFKKQLTVLNTLLPTLHVNLVTCTAFTCSANKYEFLDLAYTLMSRLQAIEQLQHPISPLQSSLINTDFKVEFGRCLEPLLSIKPLRDSPSVSMVNLNTSNGGSVRVEVSASSNFTTPSTLYSSSASRKGSLYTATNRKKILEKDSVFTDHFKEIDSQIQEINQKFEKLKGQVQELHRDLTLRRCLSKKNELDSLLKECHIVDTQLGLQFENTDQRRPALEKHWEETVSRTAMEHEFYQAQVNDLIRLKQENQHLLTIAKQLEPFLKSISDVTERLAPKLGVSRNSAHEDPMHALLEQISTMQPDSQHRVDAIRTAQEERQQSASKGNPIDEELIKTKEKLKAPPTVKDCSSPMLDPDVTFTIIVPKDSHYDSDAPSTSCSDVAPTTHKTTTCECMECIDTLPDPEDPELCFANDKTDKNTDDQSTASVDSEKERNSPNCDKMTCASDLDVCAMNGNGVKSVKDKLSTYTSDTEGAGCKSPVAFTLSELQDIEKGICKEKIRQMEEKVAADSCKSPTKITSNTNSLERKKSVRNH